MKSINSLILGCARFSGKYGIGNTKSIKKSEIKQIIKKNKDNINGIDTAISYIGSNKKLSGINLKNFQIHTKIPSLNLNNKNIENNINKLILNHKKKFRIQNFNTIYFHDPIQLLQDKSKNLLKVIKKIKKNKITKQIGVSIYDPSELKRILKIFVPDAVQFPLNLFDRRFLDKKIIKLFKVHKIKPYIRSVFLQGILLREKNKIPPYFSKWSDIFKKYDSWVDENKITKLEASLSILKLFPLKINLILGVEKNQQFREILQTLKKIKINTKNFNIKDKKLINPFLWQK